MVLVFFGATGGHGIRGGSLNIPLGADERRDRTVAFGTDDQPNETLGGLALAVGIRGVMRRTVEM